ncbi:MAG: Crp/Fnr family transcriptional regulator [Flavobacteriales bacterium]
MPYSTFITHIQKKASLSKADIELINSLVIPEKLKKGDFISEQDEVSKYSSYVVSGCTKTFHTDSDGNTHVVSFAVEDWWAGDLASFITNSPADYSVQCLEDTQVLHLTEPIFDTLFEQTEGFERFFRKLIQSAYVHAQKRIVNNFSLTAKEHYLLFQKQYPQIEQRVPQYLVASYLGITKEFLSKIRKEIAYER